MLLLMVLEKKKARFGPCLMKHSSASLNGGGVEVSQYRTLIAPFTMFLQVTTQYQSRCGDVSFGIRRFQFLDNFAISLTSRYHKAGG